MKKALTVLSFVPLFAAGILFISPAHASAATIFSDNFGTGSTVSNVPGWIDGGISGTDSEARAIGSGNDTASPDGGRFAVAFGDTGYICHSIAATGYNSVQLSYYWRGDSDAESSDHGIVEIKSASGNNCTDGSGWTQLQSHDLSIDGSWSTQAAFTNAGMNNTSFLLRYRNASSQSDEHFRVDGVSITGTAILLSQTISFGALSAKTYGDADFDLSASASSGLTVAFGATGACSMADADTVHLTGSGSCTITASQTGNGTYSAATPVQQSFSIAQKAITVTGITIDNKQYDGNTTGTIAGTAALSDVINSDDVTLGGSPVATFTSEDVADNIAVTVTGYTLGGAAAGSYTLSQPTGLTANITAKPLTVTALGLNKVYDTNTDAVVVLSTSDIIAPDVVTLSYTAPATFASSDVGAGIAIAVGGISIGGADAGNYSLQNTTTDTSASITPDLATIAVDDATFPYDGSSHSVDITGDTNPSGLGHVITYNGSITAPTNAGTYAVIAFITDVNYAGSDTATLTISKLDQTITFDALANHLTTDADFDVSATGGASGEPVTFAASGPCSMVDADTVHMSGAEGTCTITASQAGSLNYNAAADVMQSFDIAYPAAPSCDLNSSFDSFTLGSVNGQGGWSSTGPFDQAIVTNHYGYSTFGCQSLRISNAVTSGSFGDQTFSSSTANEAGETDAENGGYSGGTRQTRFEAQFDLASAVPNAQQSGLSMSVSPDRGDGARMSYLRFEDQTDGIHVFFDDYTAGDFQETDIATLTRTAPHTIKFLMDFVDGAGNDIVKIYIDGSLVHTGTSWEDYFREQEGNETRTVDSLLFRVGGSAAPATSGYGFLIDNFNPSTSLTPVTPTPEPTPTPTPSSGGGGGGGGQVVGSGGTAPSILPSGIVLGASIGPAGEEGGASTGGEVLGTSTVACTPLITTYMRFGAANDVAQVKLLQVFLNSNIGTTIPVSGFFGTITQNAVKQFQLKYKDEILAPWGITVATGNVYKLTQYKINKLSCPALELPYPTLN